MSEENTNAQKNSNSAHSASMKGPLMDKTPAAGSAQDDADADADGESVSESAAASVESADAEDAGGVDDAAVAVVVAAVGGIGPAAAEPPLVSIAVCGDGLDTL